LILFLFDDESFRLNQDVFARLSAADQKDATEATSNRKHLVNQSMLELENMNEIGPPIPLD